MGRNAWLCLLLTVVALNNGSVALIKDLNATSIYHKCDDDNFNTTFCLGLRDGKVFNMTQGCIVTKTCQVLVKVWIDKGSGGSSRVTWCIAAYGIKPAGNTSADLTLGSEVDLIPTKDKVALVQSTKANAFAPMPMEGNFRDSQEDLTRPPDGIPFMRMKTGKDQTKDTQQSVMFDGAGDAKPVATDEEASTFKRYVNPSTEIEGDMLYRVFFYTSNPTVQTIGGYTLDLLTGPLSFTILHREHNFTNGKTSIRAVSKIEPLRIFQDRWVNDETKDPPKGPVNETDPSAPTAKQTAKMMPLWLWVVIGVIAFLILVALIVTTVLCCKKKKKKKSVSVEKGSTKSEASKSSKYSSEGKLKETKSAKMGMYVGSKDEFLDESAPTVYYSKENFQKK